MDNSDGVDSLDLVTAFLNENGVKAERTHIVGSNRPGTAVWLPDANTHIHISRSDPTLASIVTFRDRVFNLHHPSSLPDLLECVLEIEREQPWTASI
jgi:hypothetical protein